MKELSLSPASKHCGLNALFLADYRPKDFPPLDARLTSSNISKSLMVIIIMYS